MKLGLFARQLVTGCLPRWPAPFTFRGRRPEFELIESRILLSHAGAPAGAIQIPQKTNGEIGYTDGTFNDSSWSQAIVTTAIGNGGTEDASQVFAGGNPGAFRQISDTISGSPSSSTASAAVGFNLYTAMRYDPKNGEITSIDYAEDSIFLSGPPDGQEAGAGLTQGGNYYGTSFFIVDAKTWTHHAFTGLTAVDFTNPAGGHPDFSANGSPITFGFVRANSTGNGLPGYTAVGGIDNWSVTVHRMLPDLAVGPLTGVPNAIHPGGAFTASLTVTNNGPGTASGNEVTDFYLSPTPNLSASLPVLGTAGASIQLDPGRSIPQSASLTIPQDTPPGTYYLVAKINADGAIPESDSANDTNDVAVSGPIIITPSPSVPLLTLALLCDKIYSGTEGAGGFEFFADYGTFGKPFPVDQGFDAQAYVNSDHAQVVIAFRGTVTDLSTPDQTATTLQNIAADVSFGGATPTTTLQQYSVAAATFLRQIQEQFPDASVTLTGHSLGGALAQLMGKASGWDAYAFNAPGSAQLYSSLSSGIDAALVPPNGPPYRLGPGKANVNYRIYGDQVSLVGSPFAAPDGQTITLPPPDGTTFSTTFSSGTDPALNFIVNARTFYRVHSMEQSVLPQIRANATAVSSAGQPDDSQAIQKMVQPSASNVLGKSIETTVSPGAALFDPTGGSDFLLTAHPGSPGIVSLMLPALSGVNSYDVRYEIGGVWSDLLSLQSGVDEVFPGSANSLEFRPLGASGEAAAVPGPFLFALGFANAGTFAGSLEVSGLTAMSVALTSSAPRIEAGDSLMLTATVSPSPATAPAPTGTVSFVGDTGTLGVGVVQADGTAVFSTTSLPPGTHTIRAVCSGDSTYPEGTSSPLTESVDARPVSVSFKVNDGAAQRAVVASLTVSFNEPVNLAAGAITLATQQGQPVPFQILSDDGETYVLAFSGNQFTVGLSEDGYYVLTVHAAQVTEQFQQTLPTDQTYSFFRLAGDINGNGKVDFADLLILAQNYGRTAATISNGDLNFDRSVTFADLLILAQNYGKSSAASADGVSLLSAKWQKQTARLRSAART